MLKNIIKKRKNNQKEEFVAYMEIADNDIVLYHKSKSFKHALSYDDAIKLLMEDTNILVTKEAVKVLSEYYNVKMSA